MRQLSPASGAYGAPRRFLDESELRRDFTERAMARIRAQHDELGSSYLYGSLAALIRELAQEGEDLAAWSALLAHRVEQDELAQAPRARALLSAVAQRAGEADALIAELRRLVERPA